MGDPKGFLKNRRTGAGYRPVCERIADYQDVVVPRKDSVAQEQASRCMDCGTPFCHSGCPVGNYIPEWNDHAFAGRWERAFELLNATNNLPEVTGRVCPAPCEYACVLGINDDAVTIRENELSIIEYAFRQGLIRPVVPCARTGKKVAVIGSGPAGLSCAMQLNRAGHLVTVFERDRFPGGILRYGIPDFKLEKWVIERRVRLLEQEGVLFRSGVHVGVDVDARQLRKEYDALCLAGGSRVPRDLAIDGRDLSGIHFAMDYLTQSNKRISKEAGSGGAEIDAKGKKVVVIGGGDTGSDCVGTANRQGAACVVQIEVMPRPAECRTDAYPWPRYPLLLKTTSSHEEGVTRDWAVLTKRFSGRSGKLEALHCARVEFGHDRVKGCPLMREVPDSGFTIPCDLAIIAIGFLHPERAGMLEQLGVSFDDRGNVRTDGSQMTCADGVFAAGDMRRGQSLVVWAVSEGRRAAHQIDLYLMGESALSVL